MSIAGVLAILLFTSRIVYGNLDLVLAGYSNILTDGSAVIAIPDIGTYIEGTALICRHNITGIPPSFLFDNWKYISDDGQEEAVNSAIGWSVSRGQSDGVVRLERIAGVSPLEGTYKCSVERHDLNPIVTETITVDLYWPITDIKVDIEVVSQESQEYNVTCMSMGGKVVGSSLTGAAGQILQGQLQPVMDQQDLRGADNYSISVMTTGGTNGDVFTCTASNGISSLTGQSVLSVGGSAIITAIVQVSSSSPTLMVSWNAPQDGASVTSYTVHYSGSGGSTVHKGSINVLLNTSALIPMLMADGRYYDVRIEAHSLHLSGYSDPVPFKPCLVSQLQLESKTCNSLSFIWDRPSYYTSTITGLIQYRALPDGNAVWLYVEDNDGTLPTLTGLAESTPYSIKMAVIDSDKMICVFSEATVAVTGLGAVGSLQVQVTDENVEITWSPPSTPVNTNIDYTVMYASLTGSDESASKVTVTTQSTFWRIHAIRGEMYQIMVTPHSNADTGDSATVIARVDYVQFQLRIDEIGECGDWIDKQMESKLTDITSQIEQMLNAYCNCESHIQKSEFHCQSEVHDSVIFRGQLFSPADNVAESTSAEMLLSVLDQLITKGSSIDIENEKPINSNCKPSQNFADDPACTMPTTTTTKGVGAVQMQSLEETPIGILAGLAVGCFIVGVMATVVGALTVYILRKHCKEISNHKLRSRVRAITTSDIHQQNNPRYESVATETTPANVSQKNPLSIELKSLNESLTIANPTAERGGACGSDADTFTEDAYDTATQASKVANPLYEFVDGPKHGAQKQQQPAMYEYILINPRK